MTISIATDPLEGSDPLDYGLAWSFDVARPHVNAGRVVDTHISLWRPKQQEVVDTPKPWLIEKRLEEMGGGSLGALAVQDEKLAIQRLERMGMPCARLADRQVGSPAAPDDPYAVWTYYAGPSVAEVLRYGLTPSEYAAALAATCKSHNESVCVGVFDPDAALRNTCIGLNRTGHGLLDFSMATPIDRRYAVFKGDCANRPWPFIALKGDAAPEVRCLLDLDRAIDLQSYLPGCPANSHRGLRAMLVKGQITASQYTFWMSRLTSPHFGGAIDRGELNIDAATQSLLAASYRELQGDHIMPSRRLHPQAQAFLESRDSLLRKMAATDPDKRFDNLEEAAQAWLDGHPMPAMGTTILRLLPPTAGEPMDGASQPDTLPSPDANEYATADSKSWDRWRQGSERPGGWAPRQAWLSRPGQLSARARVAGIGGVGIAVLAFGLYGGTVREPTPQLLQQAAELVQLERLEREIRFAPAQQDRTAQVKALAELMRSTSSELVRTRAENALSHRWSTLMAKLAVKLDGKMVYASVQSSVMPEVSAWTGLGLKQAQSWAPESTNGIAHQPPLAGLLSFGRSGG